MDDIVIKKISTGEVPMDLVYEADEGTESVADYISRGHIYGAFINSNIVGEYILLHTRPFTAEIVNIAVDVRFRSRGIGRRMIEHAINTAKTNGFRILEIATANAGFMQMSLYQKCGFTLSHIDHGYISALYPEPIIENGILCTDMVHMKMYL